ncbi:uncharacterized protein MYCFIDRAFT_180526 [Pseudocercospora fijiensis CIRAD86]|uniref:Uncharacterized protein n=1 Tax=Pseudocercospora fijiensis (strain CIRAD86) TaxID=383855 RepID=M2ZXN4_PSEFD|nr:uncharacterized protein MYCFIDRAFT_180526 [Pseudocercospora fijiensis CIRAD86]EME76861.1 hypothetical protein MYCFIDRAFT_180526 [Pseudocercospora fijiensis CIRAD86]
MRDVLKQGRKRRQNTEAPVHNNADVSCTDCTETRSNQGPSRVSQPRDSLSYCSSRTTPSVWEHAVNLCAPGTYHGSGAFLVSVTCCYSAPHNSVIPTSAAAKTINLSCLFPAAPLSQPWTPNGPREWSTERSAKASGSSLAIPICYCTAPAQEHWQILEIRCKTSPWSLVGLLKSQRPEGVLFSTPSTVTLLPTVSDECAPWTLVVATPMPLLELPNALRAGIRRFTARPRPAAPRNVAKICRENCLARTGHRVHSLARPTYSPSLAFLSNSTRVTSFDPPSWRQPGIPAKCNNRRALEILIVNPSCTDPSWHEVLLSFTFRPHNSFLGNASTDAAPDIFRFDLPLVLRDSRSHVAIIGIANLWWDGKFFGSQPIKSGFCQQLNRLQGQRHTFWTGATWCFGASSSIWNFTEHEILPILLTALPE